MSGRPKFSVFEIGYSLHFLRRQMETGSVRTLRRTGDEADEQQANIKLAGFFCCWSLCCACWPNTLVECQNGRMYSRPGFHGACQLDFVTRRRGRKSCPASLMRFRLVTEGIIPFSTRLVQRQMSSMGQLVMRTSPRRIG